MGYIDVEDALQSLLNSDGFSAHAKPLPASFSTPCVTVDLLNAYDDNRAQAVYDVDFDCRAGTYAEAAELECSVGDWVRSLEGGTVGGVPCYRIDQLRIGRCQPDAAHQDVILATVSASLRLRVAD